ncbi:MAG: hypothetical protein SO022_00725 [Selenomonadaceae bacterium]|nr:hypothetical protein [Selenomonadaceae bacterium]
MNVKKIYIDMDGVIVDFVQGIRDLCGMEPSEQGKAPLDEEMWEAMKHVDHFFSKLKPMPGAVEMVKALHAKFGDRCEILTAIPKPNREIHHAKEDKIEWVKKYIGKDIVVNVVYRAEKKQFCKGNEYILIDDFEKNVQEWQNNGGVGIVFTNPDDVLKYFRDNNELK